MVLKTIDFDKHLDDYLAADRKTQLKMSLAVLELMDSVDETEKQRLKKELSQSIRTKADDIRSEIESIAITI
jgi:hypothetical protein